MCTLLLICALAIGQETKKEQLVGLGVKGTIGLNVPTGKLDEYQRAIRAAGFEKRVQIKDGRATIENPLATELERLNAIEIELLLPPLERVTRPFSVKPEKVGEFEQLLSRHLVSGSGHHLHEQSGAAYVCSTISIVDAIEKEAKQRGLLSTEKPIKTIQLKHAKATDLRFSLQTRENENVYVTENQVANSLFLHGEPGDIAKVEALIAKWDQPTNQKMIVKQFPLAESKMKEVENLVTQLGSEGVRLGYDGNAKAVVVSATQEKVEQIEKAMNEKSLLPTNKQLLVFHLQHADATKVADHLNSLDIRDARISADARTNMISVHGNNEAIDRVGSLLSELDKPTVAPKPDGDARANSIKIFQLNYADASKVARALSHLGLDNVKITAEAGSNSIVVRGKPGDLNIIEAILSNLDIKRAAERQKAPDTNTANADKHVYVYRLVNKPASEVADRINGFQIEGAQLTAEDRTNSVLIQANSKELKTIVGIIGALDMKDFGGDEAKQAAPNPAIGTLWTEFAKAEAKSITTAGEVRTAATKFGDSHPTMLELKNKLETDVKVAFNLRHRLQQAEAQELRRQLTEIESRLQKREKNEAAIIKARIDSLLKMDELGWEAMVKPRTTNTEIANDLGSTNESKAVIGDLGTSSEADALWAQIQRREYLAIQAQEYPERQGAASLRGVQIQGIAFVPYGRHNERLISIGAKSLPCRSLGKAPMYVAAYYNNRYPSRGVTELGSVAVDTQTAWAFVPGVRGSLTKVKVFSNPASDMSFDPAVGFGIDAEGKIEQGGVVCSSSGEFLGLITYPRGSLGVCLSAPAIAKWLEQNTLEPSEYLEPKEASVLIALKGSRYLGRVDKENNRMAAIRATSFAGTIVNGVIVTHPAVADSDLRESGKILQKERALTVESMSRTSDQRFTLIWCKELKPEEGFLRSGRSPQQGDFVNCLDVIAESWRSEYVSTPDPVWQMGEKYTDHRLVSQSDRTGFDIHWLGVRNAVGMGVVGNGGHFLGVGVSDEAPTIVSTEQFEKLEREHTVHILPAKEILRLIEEETKKLKEGGSATPPAVAVDKPAPNRQPSAGTLNQKEKDVFWNRIKEPEALIRVSVNHKRVTSAGKNITVGAIVKGCILLPSPLHENELAEVGVSHCPSGW